MFLLNFTEMSREVFSPFSTLILISSQLSVASETYLSDTREYSTQPTILQFSQGWISTHTQTFTLLYIRSVCEHCRQDFPTHPFLPVDVSTTFPPDFNLLILSTAILSNMSAQPHI